MKINTEWHGNHKIPQNPSPEQRLKWHIEHARQCSCRRPEGKILAELEKRYLNTHQEFWLYFTPLDHKTLGLWAAHVAERVLPLFETKCPHDSRPREAILTLREWVETGKFKMAVIRGASLGAHAAARAVKEADLTAHYAARAAGQAVAAAHAPTHALGTVYYAFKVHGQEPKWFKPLTKKYLPEKLGEWVKTKSKQLTIKFSGRNR